MNAQAVKRERLENVLSAAASTIRLAELVVGDVMTRSPSCIHVDTTALDLTRTFQTGRFRHLLVVDDRDRLCGVVSDRDVIGLISPIDPPSAERLAGIPTSQIMSTDLVKVTPRTPLSEATRLMVAHGIHCLPVVEHDQVAGIVTSTDLKLLLQLLLDKAEAAVPA